MSLKSAPQIESRGHEYGVKHFQSTEDGISTKVIAELLDLTEVDVLNLHQLGAVYINNVRKTEPTETFAHTLFRVHTKPRRYFIDHDWKSRVVHEDTDFIVLNKPSGIPSHPSVDNVIENSLTQTELALRTKLYISHRLDTTTEGLIIYGKNTSFVKEFNILLENKMIEKKYIALVQSEQTLTKNLIHYMEPSPRAPKKVTDIFNEQYLPCELIIEDQFIYRYQNYYDTQLLKIILITGRTHQIRSQLAFENAPIIGDQLYGSKLSWDKKNPPNYFGGSQIALKSQKISFIYKGKQEEFVLSENFND